MSAQVGRVRVSLRVQLTLLQHTHGLRGPVRTRKGTTVARIGKSDELIALKRVISCDQYALVCFFVADSTLIFPPTINATMTACLPL